MLLTWRKLYMNLFYMHLPQCKGKKSLIYKALSQQHTYCITIYSIDWWKHEFYTKFCFLCHSHSTAALKILAPIHCGCLQFLRTSFLRRDAYSTFFIGAWSNTGASVQWVAPKTLKSKNVGVNRHLDLWYNNANSCFWRRFTISNANILPTLINKLQVTSSYD